MNHVADMPDQGILSQISAAFSPYTKSPDKLYDVRVQIARYIESRRPQEDKESTDSKSLYIPSHITGLRRLYLEALHANNVARQEYRSLRNEIRSQSTSSTNEFASINTIQTHLELLRLQKQYQKYQILSHYTVETERLAEQSNIYDTQPIIVLSTTGPAGFTPADHSPLLAQAQELTRNLEISVLQANHQMNQERQLLEKVKSRSPLSDRPSPDAKMRALIATSAELTRWIEDSLAKCDMGDGNDSAHNADPSRNERNATDHDQAINEQYGKYLEARTRLLDAAFELASPLPPTKPAQPASVQQAFQPTITYPPAPTPIIPTLDTQHLPLLNQNQALTQSQSHINDILSRHTQDLSDQLLRLNDESHLLPSYPILAKSKKTDQEVSEVERLLNAWKFAMDAAGTATGAVVEKQTRIGERAVDEVEIVLDGLEEGDRVWGKLESD